MLLSMLVLFFLHPIGLVPAGGVVPFGTIPTVVVPVPVEDVPAVGHTLSVVGGHAGLSDYVLWSAFIALVSSSSCVGLGSIVVAVPFDNTLAQRNIGLGCCGLWFFQNLSWFT